MAVKRSAEKKKAKAAAASSSKAAIGNVELPADCRLSAQAALKTQLLEVLERGDIVMLDGSAVERIDTAALQLLVIFQREVAAGDHQADWHGASDVLREAADLLGMAQLLKLPAVGSD